MSTFVSNPEQIPVLVNVNDETIRVQFSDGLVTSTPISRFPRLMRARPEQRNNWRLIGKGDGIHWPEVDEDISVRTLLSSAVPSVRDTNIREVPRLIGELYKTTRELSRIFGHRSFTPDGHLVGSIGEVVAEYIYDLTLQPASTPGIDAHARDGRSVQIKLTGGSSYGVRWSSTRQTSAPDLLLCLRLTGTGFSEVYNGLFPVDLLVGRKDSSNGQLAVSVSKLLARNESLLPKANSFASINRWFTPSLSDVA